MFKDLLASGAQPSNNSIDLEASAIVIDQFLVAVLTPSIGLPNLTLLPLLELIDIVNLYACDTFKPLVERQLTELAWTDPWGVLQRASDIQDLDLARRAIQAFSIDTFRGRMEAGQVIGVWSNMEKLDPTWQLSLLREVLPSHGIETAWRSEASWTLSKSFQDIAQSFQPPLRRK